MDDVSFDFDDRTVVVTGGSSGIGRATAIAFGDAGATVLVADVRRDPKDDGDARPTDDVIADRGGTATYHETDVSDPVAVADLVDAARRHGGVDVMVNNAAVHLDRPFLDVTPEELDRLHDVNVRGVFFGTQAAAADMLDRDDPGCIVNTASISSTHSQPNLTAYDASKGAVRNVTRTAALELGEHGVRVNAVAPGQIATEFFEGWSDEAVEAVAGDDLVKPVPLGRAGTPADLPGAYLFLASDAASYVTGETLYVDGGWQVT